MKYSQLFNRKKTPQTQPIPNSSQTLNSAHGYTWEVDRWKRFDRFLILGSEGGTYYVGARRLTVDNTTNVIAAIKEDGERAIARITEISRKGRAPKNDAAVFALALAASVGNDQTRALAFEALPQVCRTGTHLFAFTATCRGLRGWGRGMRKAVGRWYNAQTPEALTYGLVKYQAREGYSNRDLLRLAHPKPESEEHRVLYKWVVSGELVGESALIQAVTALRNASVADAARLIREFRIPREAVPTQLLTDANVWQALLESMPLTALIRNLGTLTKLGVLQVGAPETDAVVEALGDLERLRKARIHPIAVLIAMVTYAEGRGVRGSGTWAPVPNVLDALNDAFYATFETAPRTGKRLVLGLDVSGSMSGTRVAGSIGLDCRRACGAMALLAASTEQYVHSLAFDTQVYKLAISKRQRLDDVVNLLAKTGGGGTDCAAPIRYAIDKRIEADAFVIYTDSETWAGGQHPVQALVEYRRKMQIDAKMIVVAMASNRASIADPKDAGTLDVQGFDASVPQVIAEFLRT